MIEKDDLFEYVLKAADIKRSADPYAQWSEASFVSYINGLARLIREQDHQVETRDKYYVYTSEPRVDKDEEKISFIANPNMNSDHIDCMVELGTGPIRFRHSDHTYRMTDYLYGPGPRELVNTDLAALLYEASRDLNINKS